MDKYAPGTTKGVTSQSVVLTWLPSKSLPAGAVADYSIVYLDGGVEIPVNFVPVSKNTAMINGLSPNKKYRFIVREIVTVDGKEYVSLNAAASVKTLKLQW